MKSLKAKSDSEDAYEQLKRHNYQLYRDAIMYSEIAIMKTRAELNLRQASDIESLFVSFANHVINTLNEDPKI
jgi:hypothetical protein